MFIQTLFCYNIKILSSNEKMKIQDVDIFKIEKTKQKILRTQPFSKYLIITLYFFILMDSIIKNYIINE